MDFSNDLKVDAYNLDLEWVNFPSVFMQYSEELAKAQKEADRAKLAAEVCEAQVDKNVRADPAKYGIEGKPTEATIKAAIHLSVEYNEAQEALNEIRYKVNQYGNAVRALEHKKRALENLVILHGQSYFVDPKLPKQMNPDRFDEWKQPSKVKTRKQKEEEN